MKRQIVVTIDCEEERCVTCNWFDWWPGDHSCDLHGWTDGVNRNASCLAAERKLRDLVEAGTQLRHGINAQLAWDRALAAMGEEK